MSKSDSSLPKTISVTPSQSSAPTAPAAPAVPDYVSQIPEGADVFVLVPSDGIERQHTLDQLDDALFKYFENVPPTHHELKAARLPFGSVLLVAHTVQVRAKREDGTFGQVHKVHIGGPIDLKQFSARSQDGYTWTTDLGAIVDAVTKAARHTNGTVWLGQLSGDPLPDQKVLKLVRC